MCSSLGVQLHKLFLSNVSRGVGVALGYEFLQLVVCYGELEEVWQHTLQIVHCYVSLISLVEEFEAFPSLIVAGTLVPPAGDHGLDAVEVDLRPLDGIDVVLAQVVVDLLLRHLVEAEVVQDVAEVRQRYETRILLVIEVEGVLEIRQDLTRQLLL